MKNLERLLDLIKKTGDRYVFEDKHGNLFVALSIDDYENIVLKNSLVKDLSEEELLNKINKDIAIWKANQEDEKLLEAFKETNDEVDLSEETEEDQYYFEPVEDED